jgi:hypothetical protein
MPVIMINNANADGSPGGTAWTTTMSSTLGVDDNNWENYTIKHVMTPAALEAQASIPGSATLMRFTFQASSTEALTINVAYVGHKSGADAYDVASFTPITFNSGDPNVVVPAGGTIVSDPITFTYDGVSALVVSFYCPNDAGNTGGARNNSVVGHQTYYRSGSNTAATTDDSGLSSAIPDRQNIIQKIEFGVL